MAYIIRERANPIDAVRDRIQLLYQYRYLIQNLVSREVRLRYKNSFLGFFWSFLNPLLIMTVFTLVFQVFLGIERKHFQLWLLCALLPWNWCITSVMGSVSSIVANSNLIMKVFFPREVLPVSLVFSNLVQFLLALCVYMVWALIVQIPFSASLLLLPVVLFMQLLFLAGLGLFLSALNVFYRDVGIIMEAVTLAWFFLTPIFYDISEVKPGLASFVYRLNPMASLIASYRSILYYGDYPGTDFFLRTFVTCLLFFIVGYAFFLKLAPNFGEEL